MRRQWRIILVILLMSVLLAGAGVNHAAASTGQIRPTIAAGSCHSLAVKNDGTVWAWGFNSDGQLGLARDEAINLLPTSARQVDGISGVVSVAAGDYHSLALKSNGMVYTWGKNDHGQLGDGANTDCSTPVQVRILGVTAIAAGGSGEDVHSLALKSDGTVWAWGGNKHGELGDGSTVDRSTPIQVQGLSGVTAIAAGDGYSLAIINGTVWGWGCPAIYDTPSTNSLSPVQITGLWNAIAIGADGLVLVSDGSVWRLGKDWVPTKLTDLSRVTAGLAVSNGINDMGWYEDGTVWNEGLNYGGALGVDDFDDSAGKYLDPVQVKNLSGASCAAAGSWFGLALKNDGTVWAWGLNDLYQLGDNTDSNRSTPVQVKNFIGFLTDIMQPTSSTVHLSAGDIADSDAVQADLDALSFNSIKGNNSDASNITSKLTLPSTGDQGTTLSWSSNPAGIIALDGTLTEPATDTVVTLTAIIGKGSVNCAKDIVLTVKAGTGGSDNQIQIVPLAAGYFHSLAIKHDGCVWAWGMNDIGQLGDGTTTNHFIPVEVPNLQDIKAISAGDYHNLVLTGTGTVWAWGKNSSGQLGDGSKTEHSTPIQVAGLTGVTAIAAGGNHSLALTEGGTIKAWGGSFYGQVGDGGTITKRTPRVQVSSLAGVTAVAAGAGHSLAILGSDGSVWAWGDNSYGQLGDGTTTNHSTPVKVPGLSGITAISATFRGNYSLAVKSDGSVWAWGANGDGQLGDGTKTKRNTPVKVCGLDGVRVIAVAAGQLHSLALASDGSVWGWGNNFNGQVGDGIAQPTATIINTSASKVVGLTGVTAIAAGGFHSLAAKNDGSVWTWGANRLGQLGVGNTDWLSTPAQVQNESGGGCLTGIMQPDGLTVISVSKVDLNLTEMDLICGQNGSLTATITPADAGNQQVTWNSSNPEVAGVAGSGLTAAVNAISAGETVITVTTADGSKSASCRVTVSEASSGDGSYTNWEGDPVYVSSTKDWTIKFNSGVSPSSIKDSNFFIASDINGINKVSGTSLESPDAQTIVIRYPDAGWNIGSTYYLFVSGNVKSNTEKFLNRGIRKKFMVES